jgi:hypothetical protein
MKKDGEKVKPPQRLDDGDRWLDVNQAAAKMKMSRSSVYRLDNAGLLPLGRRKNPRITRVSLKLVEEFMKQRNDYVRPNPKRKRPRKTKPEPMKE